MSIPSTYLAQPSASLRHAISLMQINSITPFDNGCQDYLTQFLTPLGFHCKTVRVNGVSNLIARRGKGKRHIAFSGHTDVVPPGPLARWKFEPFSATVSNNVLYGRGAADMKTGIAAMLAACERILPFVEHDDTSFWWLITSDEEGEAEFGSKWISEYLTAKGINLSSVVVGEPTGSAITGDTIKVGRRGSLSGEIILHGKQGHVAYPHSSVNALHLAANFIQAMAAHAWDRGSADFPGTSYQTTGIDAGAFTDNLVPGQCKVNFNIRYSDKFTEGSLKTIVAEICHRALPQSALQQPVSWERPCESFLSQPSPKNCLIKIAESAIKKNIGQYPLLSTSGGTSDGRFFASPSTQVVEIGVPNHSIHQINEHIHLSDLITLEDIYADMLKDWLSVNN
ncbi:succinyl-diaminopimelate desuccinylase [Alteromonas sediminis]|uniref:Succinyl-diaminopimelate desuccinylase n=1 Tax=Alteromonas sediminis TaxID=2259342 RepID=A0A3N5XYV5_9ALTE|nr:succinyl-diaminopimelate desuccinylase [Alteromonas sediminis]RPJ65633.1 succinyl-diaminopimelate desuccinylase [Alteromonas sediminis]